MQGALRRDPTIAAVPPNVTTTAKGSVFQAVLKSDPYSEQSINRIPALRMVARDAGGPGTLIGGPTAQERYLRASATRDNRVIIPIVLELPLVFLTQIGLVVAFGVLLDTLLVRSVLVPALVFDIGQRIWWPSRLAKRDEPEEPEDGDGARRPEPEPAGTRGS